MCDDARCGVVDAGQFGTYYIETEDDSSDHQVIANVVTGIGDHLAAQVPLAPRRNYVYRQMGIQEFNESLRNQNMCYSLSRNHRKGEKWVTESLEHTRQFHNRGVTGPEAVAEYAIGRPGYREFRGGIIPQRGSGRLQPREGRMTNIWNAEHLEHRHGKKVNIGIKGRENVDLLNKHVISVKKVNPNGFMNRNRYLRWVSRNKLRVAGGILAVAIDVGVITLSIIEDGGTFGENTQVNVGGIVGSLVGEAIGAAIGSLFPGAGTFICGLVGSIIGSFIGSGIVRLFLGVSSEPGPGAPVLDTNPYPTAFNAPGLGVDTGVVGVPRQQQRAPSTGAPTLGLATGASGYPNMH